MCDTVKWVLTLKIIILNEIDRRTGRRASLSRIRRSLEEARSGELVEIKNGREALKEGLEG